MLASVNARNMPTSAPALSYPVAQKQRVVVAPNLFRAPLSLSGLLAIAAILGFALVAGISPKGVQVDARLRQLVGDSQQFPGSVLRRPIQTLDEFHSRMILPTYSFTIALI